MYIKTGGNCAGWLSVFFITIAQTRRISYLKHSQCQISQHLSSCDVPQVENLNSLVFPFHTAFLGISISRVNSSDPLIFGNISPIQCHVLCPVIVANILLDSKHCLNCHGRVLFAEYQCISANYYVIRSFQIFSSFALGINFFHPHFCYSEDRVSVSLNFSVIERTDSIPSYIHQKFFELNLSKTESYSRLYLNSILMPVPWFHESGCNEFPTLAKANPFYRMNLRNWILSLLTLNIPLIGSAWFTDGCSNTRCNSKLAWK